MCPEGNTFWPMIIALVICIGIFSQWFRYWEHRCRRKYPGFLSMKTRDYHRFQFAVNAGNMAGMIVCSLIYFVLMQVLAAAFFC